MIKAIVERVYDLEEFKKLVKPNPFVRVHYKIDYFQDPQGVEYGIMFKLQGISKMAVPDDEMDYIPVIMVVEYFQSYSVKWNDKEVIKLMDENPTLRTADAMIKILEKKAKEFLEIAREFNATEGQYILR